MEINSPEFTIKLIRTPHLPPRFATFYVPLYFGKLDLKDYLLQAYKIRTISVRSYVEYRGVTRTRRDGSKYGKLRRLQPRKKMTVEMYEPFFWPKEPENMSAYVFYLLPFNF